MENFVHLDMETYEGYKAAIKEMTKALKESNDLINELEEDIERIKKIADSKIKKLNECILQFSFLPYYVRECDLAEVTNFYGPKFALMDPIGLLKLGITKEEMIDFITEQWKKQQQAKGE